MRRASFPLLIAATALLAGCNGGPSGVATNPPYNPGGGSPGASASASPGAAQASGPRTILSPLGLNMRSQPSTTGSKLGSLAQGAQVTVTGYTASNGGWYQVQGATQTGWITADATLSAPGTFISYSSVQRGFNVLYPANWTFAEEPTDVVFRPLSGSDSIVVRTGASTTALGPTGEPGYVNTSSSQEVVCGVTTQLVAYTHSGTGNATPASAGAPLQQNLAQMRLGLDPTHAMALDFNYSGAGDLDIFGDFYNSLTFPFPECEAASPASPSPSPGAQ